VPVLDHVLIPTRDGTRLSARIWLPEHASADSPVPALLEYLPYRKGDWTAVRDAQRHPWYAAHGYASVRVDLRGSGDSEGVLLDEYAPAELNDGVDVIEWLAAQPWCTGRVGMFGISWGGFNSLQIAALRPPALKAIVTVCSTDDRYADDVHYFGGAVLGIDMLGWSATMLATTALPPDPERVGDWREQWEQRLDALVPFADTWLAHQERDAYWRHGSVCEDYAAIEAPVLAVGGWADPYRNTVLRLLSGLSCPAKGIIGPWAHQYPDIDRPPGPRIGFLQETLRWWDRWLRDMPNGVEAEPALRAWMQDSVRPATAYPTRPGRWVTEPSWPSPQVSHVRYPLGQLAGGRRASVIVRAPQHTGIDAGRFFPYGNPADLPPDQRAEDGRSVHFSSGELDEPVEVLGHPRARLHLRAGSDGNVIVRLCDVAPDGSSTLVTRGCLNLARRAGMDRSAPALDAAETVEVAMSAIAWVFPPGHRMRLSVSDAYWPWVWPRPYGDEPVVLSPTLSELILPVRDGDAPSEPVRFEEAEQAPPLGVIDSGTVETGMGGTGTGGDDGGERGGGAVAGEPPAEREVRYFPQNDEWRLIVNPNYAGTRIFPDGLRKSERALETYSIRSGDPLSATAASEWHVALSRTGWAVEVDVRGQMTGDAEAFHTTHSVRARLDGVTVFERSWQADIPRASA
jgi:putative CocE/NonD family hydrolase